MELKEGYKQTEGGVIPSDWEILPLSVLTTLMTNGFVGTAKTHYTESDEGVLYIQGYNVEENDFNFNGIKRVSPEFHKKQSKSCLRKDDLLTVQTGDVGLTTIVPKELEGSNCHALIITRFKKGRLNSKFFAYYLNSAQGRARLKEIETGTTMKHINVGDMIHFLVPIPPSKAEQTDIATALSDADALIQSLERLIAKKRNIKQGAMQELLKPKEGWVVKKLGEIAFFTNGKAHEQFIDDAGDYIVVNSKFISTEGEVFKNASVGLCPLNIGDITMVMSDIPNGKALAKCFIIPKSGKYTLNQRICALRTETLDTIFLAFVINRNKYFLAFDSGTGQTNLKKQDVLECPINLPTTKKEQIAIAKVLSDMDAEMAALETILEKYKQIKQGMMQELLTGRTRLV